MLIFLDYASLELQQCSCRMCGPMKISVDTRSWEWNSVPYECEADTLPHDHGHHIQSVTAYGKTRVMGAIESLGCN